MSQKYEFQIYDYLESHQQPEYENSDDSPDSEESLGVYTISLFGRTMDDKDVFVQVQDYTPYFYLKIPDKWKKGKVDNFMEFVKSKVWGKYRYGLIDYDIVSRHVAWGFTADANFKFVRLIFNNKTAMSRYNSVFNNKLMIPGVCNKYKKYKVYESNILPMLRFTHIRDIDGCGWVEINKKDCILVDEEDDKISRCDIELKVKWTKINPIKKDAIAPFRVVSMDIETFSGDGKFPQPHRDDDKIIQIGSTFSRYGKSECYYQHMVTLRSCDPIENADVESYEKEEDVILSWVKMMNEKKPDIITGYNIFFFDENYIYERSCHRRVQCKTDASMWSKLKYHECKFNKITLSSSALGDNHLRYYETPGIVHIDIMKVIQKDYKLDGWKLDYVASQFIRGEIESFSKEKINGKKMWKLSCKKVNDIAVEDYIHIEMVNKNITDRIGTKFKIKEIKGTDIFIDYDKELKETDITGFKLFWSQAKDDVGPKDIFRLQLGDSKDRAIVAKYCLKDCRLCNLLINKLDIITNNISMANVCSVPLSFLFFRGQGVKLFSLVAKKFRKENYVLPVISHETKLYYDGKMYQGKMLRDDDESEYIELLVKKINGEELNYIKKRRFKREKIEFVEDESYEGAIVFEPDPALYTEPVPVLDYASLYPRSIMHKNLSHETIVLDEIYDNLPEYHYFEASYKNNDGSVTKCRFAKRKDGKLGLIPQILSDLLDERSATKKRMKSESDAFKKALLDGHQLALKITANSLYGQMGASTSPVCMKHIAACTTAIGREMLTFAKKYMEELYPSIFNGLKYAHQNNDLDMKKKILDIELIPKLNNEKYSTQEIDKTIEKFSKDYTLQPIIRYGDTDSVFCGFHFRSDCKPITNKKLCLDLWKKILYFGFTLMKDNLDVEYHRLWEKVYYNNYAEIEKLEIPVTEDYYEKSCYQKDDLPEEQRMFNMIKEYYEESYLPWLWSLRESYFAKRSNLEKLTVNWGSYLVEKHGFEQAKLPMQHLENIKEFCENIVKDYIWQPILTITKDNKRLYKVKFYQGGKVGTDHRALEYSIKSGQLAGDFIKSRLPFPHDLEYEKTFWPFLILTKKRYVGNKYEFDPNSYKQDSMGIVLKRRDNAPIVKLVCGGIVNILMNELDPNKALEFTDQAIKNMFDGMYNMKYFVITKTLRDNYKDRTRIAHAVLADRIAIRDPGNKPQANDRIAYANIVVEGDMKKMLQGDKIETPQFIKDNKCELDYLHYLTNQIMKPALQFLSLAVEGAEDVFNKHIIQINNKRLGRTNVTSFFGSSNKDSDSSDEEGCLVAI